MTCHVKNSVFFFLYWGNLLFRGFVTQKKFQRIWLVDDVIFLFLSRPITFAFTFFFFTLSEMKKNFLLLLWPRVIDIRGNYSNLLLCYHYHDRCHYHRRHRHRHGRHYRRIFFNSYLLIIVETSFVARELKKRQKIRLNVKQTDYQVVVVVVVVIKSVNR